MISYHTTKLVNFKVQFFGFERLTRKKIGWHASYTASEDATPEYHYRIRRRALDLTSHKVEIENMCIWIRVEHNWLTLRCLCGACDDTKPESQTMIILGGIP